LAIAEEQDITADDFPLHRNDVLATEEPRSRHLRKERRGWRSHITFETLDMKKIPSLFTAACVAAIGSVGAMMTAHAAEPLQSGQTDYSIGTEPMQLAQADTTDPAKAKTGPKLNLDEKGVILKGYDPVAYFKQGKAVKGKPSIRSTYKGAIYLFASESDKADFDNSPDKFAPQYGGFCAYSMSKHRAADIDPNVFFIYKGKLYVCTNQTGLKVFSSNPDANIKKADDNFQLYELPSSPGFRRYIGG
jgi:YHS domain-containing protein